jgi:hypothetical protein
MHSIIFKLYSFLCVLKEKELESWVEQLTDEHFQEICKFSSLKNTKSQDIDKAHILKVNNSCTNLFLKWVQELQQLHRNRKFVFECLNLISPGKAVSHQVLFGIDILNYSTATFSQKMKKKWP